MIARIWHGYTTPANAEAYDNLVTGRIFKEIESKTGEGFERVQLLKRDVGEEIEFTTIIWFRSLEAIKKLTGKDHEIVYVPEEARKLLVRFDQKVMHSDLRYVIKK